MTVHAIALEVVITSRDFCYWLQGFLELTDAQTPMTERQVESVKKHLNMVFAHEIDPSFGDKKVQDKLNSLHSDPSRLSDTLLRC